MKFCDERIQKHLLNGGKIKRVSDNGGWDYRPIILDDDCLRFADKSDEYYKLDKEDLTDDTWEIVRPEYNWQKIIKDEILCVFWDSDPKACAIGYLKYCDLSAVFKYRRDDSTGFQNCKPFNPNDYDITDNLKEYEL